jgi:hypothetical protein
MLLSSSFRHHRFEIEYETGAIMVSFALQLVDNVDVEVRYIERKFRRKSWTFQLLFLPGILHHHHQQQ